MACIYPRKNKDGSVTWRVLIRRKGIKPFITAFFDKDQAEEFVRKNEEKYCLSPETFTYDHLKSAREREFKRKNHG